MARPRLVNIEDAKVKTLTVELKALTVSGKQMTLSTFRQLPVEDIWTDWPEDPGFRGIPWGRVLYFWGGQIPRGFHLVWQDADELFRCHIDPLSVNTRDIREAMGFQSVEEEATQQRQCDSAVSVARNDVSFTKRVLLDRREAMTRPIDDRSRGFVWDDGAMRSRPETNDEVLEGRKRRLREAIEAEAHAPAKLEQAIREREEVVAAQEATRARVQELHAALIRAHQTLAALPQLYIAV